MLDPAIKYGGGSKEIRDVLITASDAAAEIEKREKDLASRRQRLIEQDIEKLQEALIQIKRESIELLSNTISEIEKRRRPR